MNYKSAYLHLFNRLTDIIDMLESTDKKHESLNPLPLLKSIQAESKDVCINKIDRV